MRRGSGQRVASGPRSVARATSRGRFPPHRGFGPVAGSDSAPTMLRPATPVPHRDPPMLRFLPPFATLVVAASALAQGYQCSLLGTQNLHPPYNGIWGYVAPNGKEYALLGSELGVAIIDCTVP